MLKPGKDIAWRDLFKKLYREWNDDALSDTAAALTYWGMLSLFPFLLFLVALTSLLLDPSAMGNLVSAFSSVAPGQATQIVSDRLNVLMHNKSRGLATLGMILTLWSASGAVSSLMQALNRCYDVRETRPYWKTRGLSILVTIAGGIVAVIAIAVTFGVPLLGSYIGGVLGAAITWLRLPVAGLIVMALWAFLYRALPNVKPKFQLITPGSVAGVVLWLTASWAFSEYVRRSHTYEAEYGALGAVIILLVWMWISSLAVLLGAELNKVLTPEHALKYHSAAGERAPGEPPDAPHEPDAKEPLVVAKPRQRPRDRRPEPSGPGR